MYNIKGGVWLDHINSVSASYCNENTLIVEARVIYRDLFIYFFQKYIFFSLASRGRCVT